MKYHNDGKILLNVSSVCCLLLDKLASRVDHFNSRSEEKSSRSRMEAIEEKLGRATNYLHDIKVPLNLDKQTLRCH